MFRTIFKRQFVIFIGTLLVIFLVLGAALTWMFHSYFYEQKRETMIKQCQRISNGYIDSYVRYAFSFFERSNAFQNEVLLLNYYLDASFFVCKYSINEGDEAGNRDVFLELFYETPNLKHWLDDLENAQKAINGVAEFKNMYTGQTVSVTGTLGGLFDERVMVVGYPIIYMDYIWGVVFMNTPVAEIDANIREVATLTLMCLFISGFIAFVLIYFSSMAISRPIRQISDVAKVIAAGNFDRRLKVKSKDEVGQLADSFNYMADSLANQEISRRAFISNISHDLRSPLTSMKGFIQAMLDGTIPPENHEKYLQIVLDETERITKMANDLMYIGKFQNFDVELTKTRFDLNELTRTTLIKFEQRINDKALSVDVSFADEKNYVEADFEKIHRVMYNLIDNAVKYSDYGGGITLSTATDARIPGKIIISVKDNGPGISPDDQKKIFERFYKSDQSRGRDKTGSGLGLAIVREFIQAHGETVRVISSLGQGSLFRFTLPRAGEE